jgi:hypothetical protein
MAGRQKRRTLYARLMFGLLTVVSVPALVDVLIERSADNAALQVSIAIAAVAVPAALFVVVDTIAVRAPNHTRAAIRRSRHAWADRVTRAMDSRSLTLSDLAAAIDVSTVEFELWMRGWRDPDPRRIPRLADVLDLSPTMLLEDLHYLPRGTYSRLLSVESTRQQIRQVIDHQSELERELGTDGIGRASLIVGSLLGTNSKDPLPWTVLAGLHPRGEGAAKIDDFQEYVAFIASADHDRASMRQQAERYVGAAWSKVSAHWENNNDLIRAFLSRVTGSEETASSLMQRSEVAIVPRLLATRCPQLGTDHENIRHGVDRPSAGPAILLMLGLYHSGSADVGALIARDWGYGFCQLSNFAVQVYGRSSARRSRYELELADWFLGNSFDTGQRWVLVPNEYDALEHLTRRLLRRTTDYSPAELTVVLLECDDNLLRYSEGRSLIFQAQHADSGAVDSTREQDRSYIDATERQHRIKSGLEALARRGAAVLIEPVGAPICPDVAGDVPYGSRELSDVDDPLYASDTDGFFSSYITTYQRLLHRLDTIFTQ